MKKMFSSFNLTLSGFPLLIYPFVLLANVMSLAGHRPGNESPLLNLNSFLVLSTLYPFVYGTFLVMTCTAFYRGKDWTGVLYSIAPLAYLMLVALSFWHWQSFG